MILELIFLLEKSHGGVSSIATSCDVYGSSLLIFTLLMIFNRVASPFSLYMFPGTITFYRVTRGHKGQVHLNRNEC